MPHQLELSETKTPLIASVLKSYYKGSYYLVEALYENKKIYLNSPHSLKPETTIYLNINK